MDKRALVLVLGDLARSPRMQYHCLSLANNKYQVTVIANGSEDKCADELESHPRISKRLISETANVKKYLPGMLAYLVKAILQALSLIYCLFLLKPPHVIIVQNPPSIPTLPLCYVYAKLAGSKLIIDWHNYGFTILALTLSNQHLLVRLYRWIEMSAGRWADAGFCVSKSMKEDLNKHFSITYPIHVLYDKPPHHFKPLNLLEKHTFLLKMRNQIPVFRSTEEMFDQQQRIPVSNRRETRFTMTDVFDKDVVMFKPKRPALIMSSTSWTEDEKFDTLLEALTRYDNFLSDQLMNDEPMFLPQLVCVITGKGPLKGHYERLIGELNLKNVDIVLPWLSAADYPKMVGSCDLGISLHESSSGVDLPMKVVDMFGCGIPVLAHHYPAINELVIEDFFGLTFHDSNDLFRKLILMLDNLHSDTRNSHSEPSLTTTTTGDETSLIRRYKKNIKRRFLLSRWEDNWNKEAKPVLDELAK